MNRNTMPATSIIKYVQASSISSGGIRKRVKKGFANGTKMQVMATETNKVMKRIKLILLRTISMSPLPKCLATIMPPPTASPVPKVCIVHEIDEINETMETTFVLMPAAINVSTN